MRWGGSSAEVAVAEVDRARLLGDEPGDDVEQRRLAGAVGPDQPDDLARRARARRPRRGRRSRRSAPSIPSATRSPAPPARPASLGAASGGRPAGATAAAATPATSASPSRPPGRSSITASSTTLMNSCGRRAISWRSPIWRADLVARRDEHGADERAGDRAHPADDEHRQQQHADVERVLLGVGAADRLDAQRAGERRRSPMLTTHAVQRGQNRSMPMAGAAISSSRVAIGEASGAGSRGTRRRRARAASAASHSHVFVPWRGTPDSPPAPRVSSCQFFTAWSTTNSTASVIIVAASPPARATATPTSGAEGEGDERRRRRSPPTEPSSTSPSPNGRSGSVVAFVATGIATSAVP